MNVFTQIHFRHNSLIHERSSPNLSTLKNLTVWCNFMFFSLLIIFKVRPQYEKSAITRLRNRLGKSLSIITDVEDSDKKKQITFAPKVSNVSVLRRMVPLLRC